MATHLDIGDPKYARAAGEILRRHGNYEAEANVTSAIRDFLILTRSRAERGDSGGESTFGRIAAGG